MIDQYVTDYGNVPIDPYTLQLLEAIKVEKPSRKTALVYAVEAVICKEMTKRALAAWKEAA